MFFRVYFYSILFAVVLWPSSTFAAVPSVRGEPGLPYHIKADSLNYDDATKTYRARGHVTITRADQSLQADAVDFNAETTEAEAWGNVHFRWGEDWLTGTGLEINLDAGIGTLYEGTLFIKESHFYIRGSKIEKIGKDSYHVADGRFTTCDGDSPAWEITGKDLRVTIEGYGTLKHAAFWARSIPVLYAPFLVFPAKIKRQTGLLVPQVSYSDRDGFEYNQPFFWAISESSDATFYEHYMEHRGFKHGVEYRYVLDAESKGTAMYDFLYDWEIDDGTADGYEGFTEDKELRLNRKRWWFRMKNDQELPAGFKAKLDVDLVSDQDYLREFDTGYSGYEHSDNYFLKEFGRELDDETETVRLNQLNLSRGWDQYSLNVDFRWYDNVIIRKNDLPDRTQQNLPSVNFTGSKQKISDTPFYFDLESSCDHFWREVGTRGYSVDLHPRVYYPVSLGKYVDFEPSVGGRETLWRVEEYEDDTTGKEDQLESREIYDLKADLSTEISRVFNLKGTSVDKIKHAIKPQVVYEYVPELEQEDLPDFVSRIDKKNVVTYSITNNFTARVVEGSRPVAEMEPAPQEESPVRRYRYNDFCRIKLSQSYNIDERREDKKTGEERPFRRPFSDIKGELEFRPYDCLDLDADATWSPYDSEFTSFNAILELCDRRGDHASVDHRYARGDDGAGTRSIVTKIFLKLFDPVAVYWEHERNMKEHENVKSVMGFIYKAQCWSLEFGYTTDGAMDEREYFLGVSLYGLGEFGRGHERDK
ncbi:MAG: LPS-assembly protein LptD [Deltaproteobacteria bacterium]|nr:LPS-assembly protein LptD [Deltaproteobacteria bacterium]MBW1795495.1 LPS-assembly protein LptD [Deltaproteobacteria bacterium]MBW2330772.1 LPS-assembly protein LptD [Deltaproteobacteria bacterium]